MRQCTECGAEFDPRSRAKREAGGLISHCPECSDDVPRVVGVTSGDGKQAACSIVRPATEQDRAAFLQYWHKATGLHKGKSCQMDSKLTTPGFTVSLVYQTEATNHKGKA